MRRGVCWVFATSIPLTAASAIPAQEMTERSEGDALEGATEEYSPVTQNTSEGESAVEAPESAGAVSPARTGGGEVTAAPNDGAAPTAEASAEPEGVPVKYGVNIDFGLQTIYNYRGINVFQERSQQDRNALFAPSVSWGIDRVGLVIGYWGAYQLTGNNRTRNVEGAVGHEQDIWISWSRGFADDRVTLNAQLLFMFYPFAKGEFVSYIEPLIGVDVSLAVDFGFRVAFYAALEESYGVFNHMYFNPWIGKSLPMGDRFSLDLGLAFGYKLFTDSRTLMKEGDNRFDVLFDAAIPFQVNDTLYVAPAVHAAWTNLDQAEDEDGNRRDASVGDEYMIYFSLNVGGDF